MYVYPKLAEAKRRAKLLNLPEPHSSQNKNKKLYIIYDNKHIHFGDRRYEDYLMHKDQARRKLYHIRVQKQKINDPTSSAYYAYRILW